MTLEKILFRQFLRLMSQRWYVALKPKIVPSNKNDLRKHLQHRDPHGKQLGNPMRLPGNFLNPRVLHPSGRERRHHCLTQNVSAILFYPKQLSPFPEHLKLPFSSDDILSGYEDIVSSGTDQFTTWVKADPDVTLVRPMVDVQKAVADFREASER